MDYRIDGEKIMEKKIEIAEARRKLNPALVYASRLTKTGKPAVENMLRIAARWIAEAEGLPTSAIEAGLWQRMTLEHMKAIRARALETGYSPASVNLMLSAIRGTVRAAWRMGLMRAEELIRITEVPNVKAKSQPSGRKITARELSALIERIDTVTASGKRDAAVISLAYCAGMRRREIASLGMENIRETAKAIEVRVPSRSGKKARTLYLDNGGADALWDYLESRGRNPGALFVTSRKSGALLDEALGEHAVYEVIKRCGERAGVELTPHDFRRTFVSHLLDQGADLTVVAGMAGHSSVQTTARYDSRGEGVKKAAARLPQLPYRRKRRSS